MLSDETEVYGTTWAELKKQDWLRTGNNDEYTSSVDWLGASEET